MFFFFSSRRRHTRCSRDWSSDVCSSDLGGGSLGFGVGAAIGAKIAVGRERPVVLHLGDGALGYSAMGFWTMARYNTAMLIVVSNNESYQIVRHNWAKDMPDSKMVRDGKYPGLMI